MTLPNCPGVGALSVLFAIPEFTDVFVSICPGEGALSLEFAIRGVCPWRACMLYVRLSMLVLMLDGSTRKESSWGILDNLQGAIADGPMDDTGLAKGRGVRVTNLHKRAPW